MQVNKMLTDSKGNLWLGSEDDGVKTIYRYKDMFNSMPALQRAIGKQPVLSVATDRIITSGFLPKRTDSICMTCKPSNSKDIPMISYSNGNRKNATTNILWTAAIIYGQPMATMCKMPIRWKPPQQGSLLPLLHAYGHQPGCKGEHLGIHGIRQHLLHFSTKWRIDQKTTLPYHFLFHSQHHALTERQHAHICLLQTYPGNELETTSMSKSLK